MASLFNKYHAENEAGKALSEEILRLINPLFEHYIDQGYSPREISHIIQTTVSNKEAEAVLLHAVKLRKGRYK